MEYLPQYIDRWTAEREYVPLAIGLTLEESGAYEIVGYENYCGQIPRTAVIVRNQPNRNLSQL